MEQSNFDIGETIKNALGSQKPSTSFEENWTKGKVLSKQDKTASGYDLRDINGKTYMFMQWKSGDYVFRGREPVYYILEKVDSQDY